MKKVLVWLAGVAVFLLTMVATAGAASASVYVFHEPPLPAKLRR